MAFVNTVKTLMPGFGAPSEYVSLLAQALVRNASTAFALTGFRNPIRNGRLRIKTATTVASTQITGIKIVGDDGTNSVTLYQDGTARTAGEAEDLLFAFISDLNLTTITVTVAMANAGASDPSCDFEVTGAN